MMPSKSNLSSRCSSAGRVTTGLLLSFLALSSPSTARKNSAAEIHLGTNQLPAIPPIIPGSEGDASPQSAERFTIRHIFHHGTYLYPDLHRRKDVINPDAQLYTMSDDGREKEVPPLMIRSQPLKMQRLADRRPAVVDPMIAAAREQGEVWALSPSAWTIDEISGPDMSDKETVVSLAEMAAAAYVQEPNTRGWQNISHFRNSTDFGWEGDGLRGHVWANDKNSTIVISLKGTTTAVFDGDETTTSDKENDNLFFSCCCGQQGQVTWRKVCDCATSTYSCNNTCVIQSLRKEHRYYQAARELYTNVTALYPDSNVWVSGHSLGGSVSSLLGMTYGLPTVTFEAPPENLAAKRLGLPLPPALGQDAQQRHGYTGTYHVGHTADPVFLGTCNGVTSLCSFAGYAMETACHTGKECVYDVVGDKGWRVSLTTHSIRGVIDNVLTKYDGTPQCEITPECVDCPLWKFYESNSSETTTSSSSSTTKTHTRTETCKTPGWWGCLDETTTTTGGTTTSTSETSTTSTCKTPGWFGCKDQTTTTSAITSPSTTAPTATSTTTTSTTCTSPGFFGGCNDPTTTVTSSTAEPTQTGPCETPGWWGCRDESSSTSQPPITSPPALPTATPTTSTTTTGCQSYAWFGLICVDPSPTETSTKAASATATSGPEHQWQCKVRSWLGFCREWEDLGGEVESLVVEL